MTDIDYKGIPGFTEDSTLESLMETFNARLVQAESREYYVGNLTLTVKTGENESVTLPTLRLVTASHKAELERARATLFAAYLLRLDKAQARRLLDSAALHESDEFIGWTKIDVAWKYKKLMTANA